MPLTIRLLSLCILLFNALLCPVLFILKYLLIVKPKKRKGNEFGERLSFVLLNIIFKSDLKATLFIFTYVCKWYPKRFFFYVSVRFFFVLI